MEAFREFELEAIRIMATDVLSSEQLGALAMVLAPESYEYTGSGYFLTVTHPSLPEVSLTLSEPAVVGESGEFRAGFVVFLEPKRLTLECHTWGAVDVPADFRDRKVSITTPPVKYIGTRYAT